MRTGRDAGPSPLIPAQAGIQRRKAAAGRQDLFPVQFAAPWQDVAGLRPDLSRWIPAGAAKPRDAGMSGVEASA